MKYVGWGLFFWGLFWVVIGPLFIIWIDFKYPIKDIDIVELAEAQVEIRMMYIFFILLLGVGVYIIKNFTVITFGNYLFGNYFREFIKIVGWGLFFWGLFWVVIEPFYDVWKGSGKLPNSVAIKQNLAYISNTLLLGIGVYIIKTFTEKKD